MGSMFEEEKTLIAFGAVVPSYEQKKMPCLQMPKRRRDKSAEDGS